MTDTVIKGSGNSRSIRSVPNLRQLAPTYDALLDLLTGDAGLPIDLGPLNPTGLEVRGTDLVKATMLPDAVEQAIWGSAADRNLGQALQQLRTLIATAQNTADGKAKMQYGSYVGTSLSNDDGSLSLNNKPAFVCIQGHAPIPGHSLAYFSTALLLPDNDYWLEIWGNVSITNGIPDAKTNNLVSLSKTKAVWEGNTVTIPGFANVSQGTYYYIAIK